MEFYPSDDNNRVENDIVDNNNDDYDIFDDNVVDNTIVGSNADNKIPIDGNTVENNVTSNNDAAINPPGDNAATNNAVASNAVTNSAVSFNLEIDCSGLDCPMPILKTKKAIDTLQIGQVLKMVSTDPSSLPDLQAWTSRTGHELIDHEQGGGKFIYYIKRK
jgi:tRNA 2-thiouridine synthesizing protein A